MWSQPYEYYFLLGLVPIYHAFQIISLRQKLEAPMLQTISYVIFLHERILTDMKLLFSIWEKTLRIDSLIIIPSSCSRRKMRPFVSLVKWICSLCLMGVVAQTIFNVAACWWRTICIRWLDGELLLIAKISQLWIATPCTLTPRLLFVSIICNVSFVCWP
jgi:hypothetical protein